MKLQQVDAVNREAYRDTQRVTIIGAVLDLFLGLIKIIVGWLGHSQALVADGIHSLSDLVTDGLVLWANKFGYQSADTDHPYGHQRFQTAATVFLGVLLIMVAIGIALDAISRIWSDEEIKTPIPLTLAVAFLSVLVKEGIYHYTMRIARKHDSNLMRANAWHSRTDALSSIVVIAGIAGTMAGWTYLDAVAAIVVALLVAHVGGGLLWDSLRELVDTGLDEEKLEKLEENMVAVDGVVGVHQLRTRRMGSKYLADVHIHVDPFISVSEGHRIGDEVEKSLLREFKELEEVIVHIDPEDDDDGALSSHLPLRQRFWSELERHWPQVTPSPRPERIVLHYIGGKIRAEVFISRKHFANEKELQELTQQYASAADLIDYIKRLDVIFV